jgi:hypothetical protein
MALKTRLVFFLTIINLSVFAQELHYKPKHTGSAYLFWGYNRDWYSKSTIHFKNDVSDDYDFTLHDAHASDKPDMQHFYQPSQITIPQYNFHVGWFFNKRPSIGVEISWDHLKYVINDNQWMKVTGHARETQFTGDPVLVTPNFVHLQHTNGNNYLMANFMKRWWIWENKWLSLYSVNKVGVGVLWSYTISSVLGSYDKGYFHYQGMVAGLETDLRLDIGSFFFIQGSLQGAFADYTDTYVGSDRKGRVKHHFYSLQAIYGLGLNVPLGK